jgi:hypothetical protein
MHMLLRSRQNTCPMVSLFHLCFDVKQEGKIFLMVMMEID